MGHPLRGTKRAKSDSFSNILFNYEVFAFVFLHHHLFKHLTSAFDVSTCICHKKHLGRRNNVLVFKLSNV